MPKKRVDKYNIACKIIEFAEKNEEITVYNMVKKLRETKLNIEEETVRRILKELEKFGILRLREVSVSKTKKEKKIYTLTVPPDISKNIIKVIYSSRSFLRETAAKVFSSVIVLVKNQNYSVIGFTGEHEFEKVIFNNALSLIIENYKPDFFIFFFKKNVREKSMCRFLAIIVSPFGIFHFNITETKEEHIVDKIENENLNILLENLKFFN